MVRTDEEENERFALSDEGTYLRRLPLIEFLERKCELTKKAEKRRW